jgi:hypothetical protein
VPRFLLGLLAGAGLLAAIAFVWTSRMDACFGRCGTGTKCSDHRCLAAAEPAPAPAKEPKRRRRHETGGAPEIQLRPGDEKMVTQGDALGRSQRIDMTKDGEDGRELTDDDTDRVFRAGEAAILRCITDAVGDAPLESGKIIVGARVESSGNVSKVRVEAPQLLQRNGLYACVRGAVTGLRFPSSGGASVVTHDYELK